MKLEFMQYIQNVLLIFYSMNNRIHYQKFLKRSSEVYSSMPVTNAETTDLLNTSNLSLSSISMQLNSNDYN